MSIFRLIRSPVASLRKETGLIGKTYFCSEKTPETKENIEDEKPKRPVISVETSIRYLNSNSYKKAYGDDPVWTHYRRNFKGQFPPDTRRNCISKGEINNGSPCPICRDEYLVVDYTNIKLITQFISPYGGQVLHTKKTGVCQFQQKKLLVAIQKAKNYGFIKFDLPHRHFDYRLYYDNYQN